MYVISAHQRYRQTDRQTDRRTDAKRSHDRSIALAWSGKNYELILTDFWSSVAWPKRNNRVQFGGNSDHEPGAGFFLPNYLIILAIFIDNQELKTVLGGD